jgi:hypothetical protein
MGEVEFTLHSRREADEPLYLHSAPPRPAEPAPGDARDPDRPLRLDPAAREPRPGRPLLPMVLAGGLAILLAAGAGAWLLQRPAATAVPAAPVAQPPPAAAPPAPPAAPVAEAAPPPEPAAPSAAPAPAKPRPRASAHAEARAKPPAAHKRRPPRATPEKTAARTSAKASAKTPAAHAKPAHAPRPAKSGLDLDALEKSLR